jgi:glutathione peroxidase
VPSNDFGNQEPGTHAEIASFCEMNYGVDFPIMGKEHVKGSHAHPFFKWAGEQGGFLSRPKWNFFKYLVGSDGQLVDWFASFTSPGSDKFKSAVEKMLTQ